MSFNLFVNWIKALPPKCDLLVVCIVALSTPKAFPHLLISSQNINFKEFDPDDCRWNQLRQQETFMNKLLEHSTRHWNSGVTLYCSYHFETEINWNNSECGRVKIQYDFLWSWWWVLLTPGLLCASTSDDWVSEQRINFARYVLSSEVLQEDIKALFYLLLSNEGFERDSLTENTAIPRISSCLWTTEKEKKQHLSVDLYIQERKQEKGRYIYI